MNLGLTGKRALVTGSSAGIGAGIVAQLAQEGAIVCVHGRDAERAEAVAAAIRDQGGNASVVLGDLTTDDGAEAVARSTLAAFGTIDILVNATGGTGDNTFTWDTTSPAQWAEQYELNTLSAVRMIRHCIPAMTKAGWGRIIQIGSIASATPLPHQVPAYCASKAALPVLAVSLARSLAGTGITINTVTSGYVETPLLKSYAHDMSGGRPWDEVAPEMVSALGIAAGRFGRPSDLAALVAFLASPVADWINGSNIRIDGGQCAFTN
ncbi:MAG: SDR family oxidoreductase [Sphingomonadales bacterium]|jgi:3-oxoacyl-[acyl-carrier protein] reductase|nr:SDR family oxidoreductase [Sphingomonadales bacterium]MBK6493078.1 SDR family oxidoreductase [Sphingomonadales bacterium]MBK6720055.1 SDR family oxidoreductase [Sphingomonadales bacterium]MBK8861595.1 SDR family oxidoreductase [Sphingomonadales bacterium]MBL0001808.1 SDR family oxidoreductase [Sphingomonadales bacterium]